MGSDEREAAGEPGVTGEGAREALLDVVEDPAFATDRRGYLTLTNAAFVDQFGYAADDDVHVSAFLADGDVDGLIGHLRELADAGEEGAATGRTIEVEGTPRNGHARAYRASVAALPGEAEFAGAAVALRDVRARRRREQLFTVMDRALRHNLRTNVSVILGYADLLEGTVGDEHEQPIGEIRDAARWIRMLGTSFRTLQAAIEEQSNRDGTVSVEQVVESAAATARRVDQAADIEVNFSARGELQAGPPVERALEQVLENAVVHNDTDAPTVEVWVAHAPLDGCIDVYVADDGPGIPEFEREVVLGEASIDQLQHGSGLGLWITRWVVEAFDGELAIEDNDPRGTVVTLRFPVADPGQTG